MPGSAVCSPPRPTPRPATDAQAGVLELFRVLVSPRGAAYHPLESLSGRTGPEGSPLDRILVLNADYAWTEDRRTVYLKIAHGREILGVLELEGFGGPERDDHDLDLALVSGQDSPGLALASVRMSREIGDARDRAAGAEAALASGDEMMTRVFNYPLGLYRTTPQGKILMATPTLARMLGYPDVGALKAVGFWDFHCDPRDRDNKRAYLDSTSMVGIFESQLRRANGTHFWAEDSCRATKDGRGQVLFYEGVIEDITARKQMKDEHARVMQLQTAVGEISERLLSPTPIEEMSSLVLDQARRLTSSVSGFVGHVDQRTGSLVPAAMTADARDMSQGHPDAVGRFHENSGLWRWILEERRAIVTSMPSLDPRYRGMPDWHLPVGPFLAVPAIMSGAIVGLIVVANAETPYLERDLNAVERLAGLYAIAVQRTRTENELRDLSLVDELTKVYNRRGFLTLSEQQMKVAHRTRKEMTLFYVDLDDLKKINDSSGHEEGDAVLVETAEVLRDAFRESDIIARTRRRRVRRPGHRRRRREGGRPGPTDPRAAPDPQRPGRDRLSALAQPGHLPLRSRQPLHPPGAPRTGGPQDVPGEDVEEVGRGGRLTAVPLSSGSRTWPACCRASSARSTGSWPSGAGCPWSPSGDRRCSPFRGRSEWTGGRPR